MEREEESVRVWVGLDLLQAQMLKQMLLDTGIECSCDRDSRILPTGEFGEIGLWVRRQDEERARALLEQMEDEMSAELDAEGPTENPEPHG